MKTIFNLLTVIALLAAVPSSAQIEAFGQRVVEGYLHPAGFTRITSLGSAVGLGTVPNAAKVILIQAESQNVRWRDDGTNPTASVGMLLEAGSILKYNGNLQNFKVIEVTGGATLNVSFYK